MTNVNCRVALTVILGLILGLAFTSVRADVKIQSLTHFGGIAGMGASNITDTSYLQGHKQRSESSTQFTGAILGALQKWKHGDKDSHSVTIYRVDENRKIMLDTDKKTYLEEPIYTLPQPSQEAPPSASPNNSGEQKEKDVRVVKSEFKVQDTGKRQTINGFQTHEYLVTWDLETENTKTHEHTRSLMTTELWNSDDARFAVARKQQAAYNHAYAQLMHMPLPSDMAKQYGLLQLNMSPNGSGQLTDEDMKSFTDKLSKIKGFSVVTDVKWDAGCISNCAQDQQTASQDQQSSDNSGALGSLLGSLMSKNSTQSSQSGQQKGTDGLTTIFQSHTEVQSIDTGNQPASLFEAPTGYTKD
ncbi:MAG: hypothetical protein WBR29_00410 [Gammaproteobacteria bacterium]